MSDKAPLEKQIRYFIVGCGRHAHGIGELAEQYATFANEHAETLPTDGALKLRRTICEMEAMVARAEQINELLWDHLQSLRDIEELGEEVKEILSTNSENE